MKAVTLGNISSLTETVIDTPQFQRVNIIKQKWRSDDGAWKVRYIAESSCGDAHDWAGPDWISGGTLKSVMKESKRWDEWLVISEALMNIQDRELMNIQDKGTT